MKFILTKIPSVEDILCNLVAEYLKEIRWSELFPNFRNVNISNDHPFEEILGGQGDRPDLFPSITVVSSNDGEAPGMPKRWQTAELVAEDLDGFVEKDWFVSAGALADLKTAININTTVYGLQHSTTWRDSTAIEIWTKNIELKNRLYDLIVAFMQGPKILELKQSTGLQITSNMIQGQRSGYYNFDFGYTLFGGRVSFSVDYPVIQAVYDSDIRTITEIQHSYREVLNG